jgi:hypothetical protein
MDPDSDPGGPKTCGSGGSGSATLIQTVLLEVENRPDIEKIIFVMEKMEPC